MDCVRGQALLLQGLFAVTLGQHGNVLRMVARNHLRDFVHHADAVLVPAANDDVISQRGNFQALRLTVAAACLVKRRNQNGENGADHADQRHRDGDRLRGETVREQSFGALAQRQDLQHPQREVGHVDVFELIRDVPAQRVRVLEVQDQQHGHPQEDNQGINGNDDRRLQD